MVSGEAVSSSIFNFEVYRAYCRLPAKSRLVHVILIVAGAFIVLAWLRFGPLFAPTCRTVALQSLTPETQVIVTGTSRVERGVDPRLLSFDTVNFSSGGLAYLTMNPLIKRAVVRAPNVELVIIEMDIFLLKGEGLIQERLFEMGLPMSDWPAPWPERLSFVLHHGGPLSAMPRIDVEYFAQSIRPVEIPPWDAKGYNPFVFHRDLIDDEFNRLYGAERYLWMHRQSLVAPLERANTEALVDLLRWLDDRGISWALCTLPHQPAWIEQRPAEWAKSVDEAVNAVRSQYPGVEIRHWDFSESLNLDRPHFHDGVHLNRRGVEIFNQALDRKVRDWLIYQSDPRSVDASGAR